MKNSDLYSIKTLFQIKPRQGLKHKIDLGTKKIESCSNTSIILLTKANATQNEVALSYHRVRGLHFLAVVFAATIDNDAIIKNGLTYE